MEKSLLAAVSAVALLFPSCAKRGLIPPGNTIDYCKIESMTFILEPGLMDTLTFHYNPDGTPSRIDRAYVGDGSPKFIFRYDRQGRLLDFIGALDNGTAESWTRYYYDAANRAVIDTTYTEALQYQSWPPAFEADALSELKHYDESGRIIDYQHFFLYKVNGKDTSALFFSQNYVYNREGNILGGADDKKIEFHRTNRVWQFVDNDYNNNNLQAAQQYNAYDLPTEVNFTNNFSSSFVFLDLNNPNFTIHYSCDAPIKGDGSLKH